MFLAIGSSLPWSRSFEADSCKRPILLILVGFFPLYSASPVSRPNPDNRIYTTASTSSRVLPPLSLSLSPSFSPSRSRREHGDGRDRGAAASDALLLLRRRSPSPASHLHLALPFLSLSLSLSLPLSLSPSFPLPSWCGGGRESRRRVPGDGAPAGGAPARVGPGGTSTSPPSSSTSPCSAVPSPVLHETLGAFLFLSLSLPLSWSVEQSLSHVGVFDETVLGHACLLLILDSICPGSFPFVLIQSLFSLLIFVSKDLMGMCCLYFWVCAN